jgi:hypothetical protein
MLRQVFQREGIAVEEDETNQGDSARPTARTGLVEMEGVEDMEGF